MNEQNTIPAEMLEAATKAVIRYETNLHSCSLRLTEEFYGEMIEVALRAAGVPALLERIADAEQEMAKVREVLHDHSVYFEAELEKRETRIAELEAALRNRICEGCNALVANVGMLHLCGCDEQRNLCSACKAGCACAGEQ